MMVSLDYIIAELLKHYHRPHHQTRFAPHLSNKTLKIYVFINQPYWQYSSKLVNTTISRFHTVLPLRMPKSILKRDNNNKKSSNEKTFVMMWIILWNHFNEWINVFVSFKNINSSWKKRKKRNLFIITLFYCFLITNNKICIWKHEAKT